MLIPPWSHFIEVSLCSYAHGDEWEPEADNKQGLPELEVSKHARQRQNECARGNGEEKQLKIRVGSLHDAHLQEVMARSADPAPRLVQASVV